MCKIINAVANGDYTVTIELEAGNCIIFNMEKYIKTLPYNKFTDFESFKKVKFDNKSIFWEEESGRKSILPFRLSIDNILFSLRE